MRRASKRDANEPSIVQALLFAGCRVYPLDRPYDLLVLRAGRLYLLEVKSKRGTLTPSQEALMAEGWPVTVVWEPEQALRAVGLAGP